MSWKHALIFAIGITTLTLIVKKIGLIEGFSMPMALTMVLSFALNLAFGGWFFSTRGFTKQGQQLGWLSSVQLSALAFIFLRYYRSINK